MSAGLQFNLEHSRPRCFTDCLVSGNPAAAGFQQHQQQQQQQPKQKPEQKQQRAQQEDQSHHLKPIQTSTASHSAKASLIARLALTGRHQVLPCVANRCHDRDPTIVRLKQLETHLNEANVTFDLQQHCKLQAKCTPSRLHPMPRDLLLLVSELENIHRSSNLCGQREARWIVGDKLLCMFGNAVDFLEMDLQDRGHYGSDCVEACDTHTQTLLNCLTQLLASSTCEADLDLDSERVMGILAMIHQRAHEVVKALVCPSNRALLQRQACKDIRCLHMRKSRTQVHFLHTQTTLDNKLGQATLEDANNLFFSGDFAPVFLGSPANLAEDSRMVKFDSHSSMELLYLQLTLKSDSFFVLCTGSQHIVGFLRIAAYLGLHLQILPTHLHFNQEAQFLEPTWDESNSEMLLEVSCIAQNEQKQRLADVPSWAGIKCTIDCWTDVSAVQACFKRERAVSLARGTPLQTTASGRDMARIVMMLAQEVALQHLQIHMFVKMHQELEYPDPNTLMRLVSLAVFPSEVAADDEGAFSVIAL